MNWREIVWRLVAPVEAGGRGYQLSEVKKFTLYQAQLFLCSEEDMLRNGRNTVSDFREAVAIARARKKKK